MPTKPRPVSFAHLASKLLEQSNRVRVYPQFRGPRSRVIFFLKDIRVVAVLKPNRKDFVPGLMSESQEPWISAESQIYKQIIAYIMNRQPTIARIGAEHPSGRGTRVACSEVNLDETKTSGYTLATGPQGGLSVIWVLWELADASIGCRGSLRKTEILVIEIAPDVLADYGSNREMEMIVPLGVVWISPHIAQNRGS